MNKAIIATGMLLVLFISGPAQKKHKAAKTETTEKGRMLKGKVIQTPEGLIEQMNLDEVISDDCLRQNGTKKLIKALTTEQIHLNDAATPELLVGASMNIEPCSFCGTRRCDYRIYKQTDGGYELIADFPGPDGIERLRTKTKGYYDLKMYWPPTSDLDTDYEILRFNGQKYEMSESVQRPGARATVEPDKTIKSNLKGKKIATYIPIAEAMLLDGVLGETCSEKNSPYPADVASKLQSYELYITKNKARVFMLVGIKNEYLKECSFCGKTRCNGWIYAAKENGGFTLILSILGATDILELPTYTNGYKDIQLKYPKDAKGYVYVETYKFT